jgi:hypothetical protein
MNHPLDIRPLSNKTMGKNLTAYLQAARFYFAVKTWCGFLKAACILIKESKRINYGKESFVAGLCMHFLRSPFFRM